MSSIKKTASFKNSNSFTHYTFDKKEKQTDGQKAARLFVLKNKLWYGLIYFAVSSLTLFNNRHCASRRTYTTANTEAATVISKNSKVMKLKILFFTTVLPE